MLMNIFYGIKQKQGQDYDSKGLRVPITWIYAEPLTFISPNQAVFGNKKHPNKALLGQLKEVKLTPKYIKQITDSGKQAGETLSVSEIFNEGDKVKVTGTTIGKGFAGVMKRHGFHGGPATHGQSVRPRHPGSIGSTTTPGRVFKGKKMAGHMGANTSTVRNLRVFKILPEENLILIKGLVPGNAGGLLTITKI